jgi:hypothetical protein
MRRTFLAVRRRSSCGDGRLSAEHGIGLFVDGANYDDVERDKDERRRAVTLSKLAKFQQLRGIPLQTEPELVARFGAINSENDRSDVRFLAALDAKPPISLSLRISVCASSVRLTSGRRFDLRALVDRTVCVSRI